MRLRRPSEGMKRRQRHFWTFQRVCRRAAAILSLAQRNAGIKLTESIFTGTNCQCGLNKYDNMLFLYNYTFIIHTPHFEEASSLIWANYCPNTLLAWLAETCFGEGRKLKKTTTTSERVNTSSMSQITETVFSPRVKSF